VSASGVLHCTTRLCLTAMNLCFCFPQVLYSVLVLSDKYQFWYATNTCDNHGVQYSIGIYLYSPDIDFQAFGLASTSTEELCKPASTIVEICQDTSSTQVDHSTLCQLTAVQACAIIDTYLMRSWPLVLSAAHRALNIADVWYWSVNMSQVHGI
jgi:hypothetical protein